MKIKIKMLTKILKDLLNQLENSSKTAQYSSLNFKLFPHTGIEFCLLAKHPPNGPVENDLAENGPVENDPAENDPVGNSPVENGPAEDRDIFKLLIWDEIHRFHRL